MTNRRKTPTLTGVNGVQQKIMELFAQERRDLYLALIEKKLPLSHSWLQENLKKLVAKGLLQESGGSPRFYSLTEKGIALNQGVGRPDIRTHGIEFTIPIIQKPQGWNSDYSNKFIKISDEIRMKNWKEEIRARWRGNFMRISDSSISVFFKEFWDPKVEINLLKAIFRALEFCKDMEEIHQGLKLGQIRKGSVIKLSAQEHAMELPKNSKVEPMQGKTFVIDWSKGVPELEFKDNQKSADHMERFADFIDAIADGEITANDIRSIKVHRKQESNGRTIKRGVLLARIKWMKNHGDMETFDKSIPFFLR